MSHTITRKLNDMLQDYHEIKHLVDNGYRLKFNRYTVTLGDMYIVEDRILCTTNRYLDFWVVIKEILNKR